VISRLRTQRRLNLLKWYLSDISLHLDDQNGGSPQGGVAASFLWLIYINDLLLGLEKMVGLKNCFALADDNLTACNSPQTASKVIKKIKEWNKSNKILMNEKKSVILPLALKEKKERRLYKNTP